MFDARNNQLNVQQRIALPVINDVVHDNEIRKVGIIGTKATIRSNVYEKRLHQKRPDLETVSLATGLLASMIENGFYNNTVSKTVISNYLGYPDFSDIDAMILACTHYPLIKGDIKAHYTRDIKVFDSTDSTADAVERTLNSFGIAADDKNEATYQFYVSDFTETFEQTARIFFKQNINLQYYPLWENI
jgi:glutamate racemase